MNNKIYTELYESPFGSMILGSYRDQLCLCEWVKSKGNGQKLLSKYLNVDYDIMSSDITSEAARQLSEYFTKKRKEFNIPLFICGTEFQQEVLMETAKIPYGKLVTYKHIAISINRGKCYKSVGVSLSHNPLNIILPCHRIVGSKNSELTGYAGGIELKRKLLRLEGAL